MSGVAAITPTLGTSPWLDATIASVASLPAISRHVLVCPAIKLAELRRRFPGALVVPETGGGMYAAINAGLAALADNWTAFTYINDDDLLLPEFAEVARRVVRMRGAGMVYGRVVLISGKGNRLGGIPVSWFPTHNRALYAARIEPVYQHGTAINRAAWLKVGTFDPVLRYCGDTDYLARLCLQNVTAECVRANVAAFRLHAAQLTKQAGAMAAERQKVDENLGLLSGVHPCARFMARLVFRGTNFPLYLERIVRHGPITFGELLARGE
ncbi:MAG: hypothetical protein KIT44_13470 [Opitutaceae bacterium]|nr:hypothetical protein [Opitutaceae bacterium]